MCEHMELNLEHSRGRVPGAGMVLSSAANGGAFALDLCQPWQTAATCSTVCCCMCCCSQAGSCQELGQTPHT